jgi:hypothetical protein
MQNILTIFAVVFQCLKNLFPHEDKCLSSVLSAKTINYYSLRYVLSILKIGELSKTEQKVYFSTCKKQFIFYINLKKSGVFKAIYVVLPGFQYRAEL